MLQNQKNEDPQHQKISPGLSDDEAERVEEQERKVGHKHRSKISQFQIREFGVVVRVFLKIIVNFQVLTSHHFAA